VYQNVYISRKDNLVHLWDDDRGYLTLPYVKYAYKRQPGGNYKSIYGDELVKTTDIEDKDGDLFEADVQPELKVLRDLYPDSDEPSKGHKVGVIDIEVNTEGGFPNFVTADKEITAISLYDWITKFVTFLFLTLKVKLKIENVMDAHWCPQLKGVHAY
jgi:hypothetical protein